MKCKKSRNKSSDDVSSYIDPAALTSQMDSASQATGVDEFEAFYKEFASESDRASAVLGAAKIDDILMRILNSRLVPPVDTKSDELLAANGPLGTMSARIDMVYRLGLISEDFRRSLHLIRKIRNTFAHNLEGCSFALSSVKSQTNALFAPYEGRLFTISFMRRFGTEDSTPVRFRTVLAIHMHRLNTLSKLIRRLADDEAWHPLMPNWERLHEKGLLPGEDVDGVV